MPATVWSLGSVLVDLTVDVPALPERGGDRLATGTRTEAGGGFNLAAAVARQGVRCRYAGPHGSGPYGDQVRAALIAEGVEVVSPQRTDGDTGFCITLVEPDGERTFVTVPGVDADLRAADLEAVRPGSGDLVAVSGYDLAYRQSGPVLAEWLQSLPHQASVALDPGPLVLDIPPERLTTLLARVAVLTLNQREAQLLGATEATGADLVAALQQRTALDPAALLVVREGAAGCIATGGSLGDRVVAVPAPAVHAVDTTGAGDTHTGVLLASIAGGADVEVALHLANRAAAISVTRFGPATAPTLAELGTG